MCLGAIVILKSIWVCFVLILFNYIKVVFVISLTLVHAMCKEFGLN